MKKIDLHQDIILSFEEDLAGFIDADKVHDRHGTYAGDLHDYQAADCRIVVAANRPYHVEGDIMDIKTRKITFDEHLLRRRHDAMRTLVEQYGLGVVLTAFDVERALTNEYKLFVIHHVEGCDYLQSLDDIKVLYDAGIRSLGFVWNYDNFLAHANTSLKGGLTALGKAAVGLMNELGMMIDMAHMNVQSMRDTLSLSKKPVINSHSNVFSLFGHPRNVVDEILDMLPRNRGVLGLSFYSAFMGDGVVSLDTYIAQVAYVIHRIGSDHVALGTDFHGIPSRQTVRSLTRVRDLSILEEVLIKKFGAATAQKFMSTNAARVIQEVV